MKNYIPLSEQEEMNLRQLAAQPGYETIFKLLQMVSLDAQGDAMECTDPDQRKRLMLLTDAQVTVKVVGSIIRKLNSYREALLPQAMPEEVAAIIENVWNAKEPD